MRPILNLRFGAASLLAATLAFAAPAGLEAASRPGASGAASSAARCNPDLAAEAYWFSRAAEGEVTRWFDSREEAQSYADPNGHSVYWLVEEAKTFKSVSYVAGINDLWAVEFDVLVWRRCEIVITGEH